MVAADPCQVLWRGALGSCGLILLFGGAGQLGQEISHRALERDIALTSLTRAQTDISDRGQVMDAIRHFKPDIVVNAAAYTKVDKAEDEYDVALRANSQGPAAIAWCCHQADIPLIHFSTDYVFDGNKAGPYLESDPTGPLGAYGRSKLAGEERVRSEHPMHIILRTSWVYGEFGSNFLKTIMRLAGEREELRVVADQHGNPTSTAQIATAVLSIAPKLVNRTCEWGTYHFAGGGVATWHTFAERIVGRQASFTGRHPVVLPITTAEYPTRAERPPNSTLDFGRFVRNFALVPDDWKLECDRVVAALNCNRA